MVVAVIDKRPQFCIDRRGSENNNNKKENSIPADKQKHDNNKTGMFPSCVCVFLCGLELLGAVRWMSLKEDRVAENSVSTAVS
jgi:hypothetical protein